MTAITGNAVCVAIKAFFVMNTGKSTNGHHVQGFHLSKESFAPYFRNLFQSVHGTSRKDRSPLKTTSY